MEMKTRTVTTPLTGFVAACALAVASAGLLAAQARTPVLKMAGADAKGQTITLSAASPADTNSITEPTKIVPVTAAVDGLGTNFTRTFPPYSLTVLQMKAK